MIAEIEVIMCNCRENCLKRTSTGPREGVRFRRRPLLKGVHFREGFVEMKLN